MIKTLDEELLSIPNIKQLNDNQYLISKNCFVNNLEFEKNKYYLIHIDESVTANEILEVTRLNWNNGVYLKSYYLKCEVIQKQGIMVQINACGYDMINQVDLQDIYLNFWINSNIITILNSIN